MHAMPASGRITEADGAMRWDRDGATQALLQLPENGELGVIGGPEHHRVAVSRRPERVNDQNVAVTEQGPHPSTLHGGGVGDSREGQGSARRGC
jgi:hypothetical protein